MHDEPQRPRNRAEVGWRCAGSAVSGPPPEVPAQWCARRRWYTTGDRNPNGTRPGRVLAHSGSPGPDTTRRARRTAARLSGEQPGRPGLTARTVPAGTARAASAGISHAAIVAALGRAPAGHPLGCLDGPRQTPSYGCGCRGVENQMPVATGPGAGPVGRRREPVGTLGTIDSAAAGKPPRVGVSLVRGGDELQ